MLIPAATCLDINLHSLRAESDLNGILCIQFLGKFVELMVCREVQSFTKTFKPLIPWTHAISLNDDNIRLLGLFQERRVLRSNKKLYKLATSERSSSGATPKSSDHSNSIRDSGLYYTVLIFSRFLTWPIKHQGTEWQCYVISSLSWYI